MIELFEIESIILEDESIISLFFSIHALLIPFKRSTKEGRLYAARFGKYVPR